MNTNKALKIISLLIFSVFHYGCTHPIEVTGKGLVNDNRSSFQCSHLDTPCEATVAGEYSAYYVAQPQRGWKFDNWQSCLTTRLPNGCEYNINAQTVRDNWFKTMPPLIAHFSESDADGDGVFDLQDIRPGNAECTGEGNHAYDSCAFNGLRESRSSVQVINTESGLQFIFLQNDNEVLRYQTESQQFLTPIRPDSFFEGGIAHVQYSSSLGGLLFIAQNNTVFFVANDNTDATPTKLFSIDDSNFWVNSFGVLDELILVHGENQEERLYNLDGDLLSSTSTEGIRYLRYLSDPETGAVFSIGRSDLDNQYSLRKMFINDEGEYSSVSLVDIADNRNIGWLELSPDGSRLLLSNGSVYNTSDLSVAFTIPKAVSPAIWLNSGELLSVQASSEWPTTFSLLRSGVNGEPLERTQLNGWFPPNALIVKDTKVTLFWQRSQTENISEYQPDNDRDNDGIANTTDAFPDDISASLDTDRDGYPDQWNEGFSEEDSTDDLNLDAFPVDTMCYLDEHGNNGNCDHGARIGIYYPSRVIQDDSGVVYLLPSNSNILHRWDTETEQYLSSISLKSSKAIDLAIHASNITYHASTGDLFIAYGDGQIRRLSLSSPNTLVNHSNTFGDIRGLTSNDNMLFAAHYGTEEIVSLDIASGLELDRQEWPGSDAPQTLEWNGTTRTLYGSVSGIQNIGVDEQGQFLDAVDFANDFSNRGSMFSVSSDGQHLVSYLGHVNRTADGALIRDFDNSALIANWLNNSLFTVENLENGSELTQWRSDFLTPRFQLSLDYQPLGLLADYGQLITVYMVDQTIRFEKLSVGDADGDGMPSWWELQNGLDDNDAFDAALDGDLDNLSNLEEYIHETSITEIDTDGDGLIDGDEVNIYASDPNNTDTDGDGLSDGDEVNSYSSSPTLTDSDNDRMKDGWEVLNGLNPANANDAELDADNDGYSNFEEFTHGTDAQTADHPRLEQWSRRSANNRNNAYFPVDLNESAFGEAWTQTFTGRHVEAPTLIGGNRSLFRVALDYDGTEFARSIEIIDADSGEVDKRYPIDADNFEVQRYVFNDGQLLLSGYLRGENYAHTKTLNSINLQSGENLTLAAAATESTNYLTAILASESRVIEAFSSGETRVSANGINDIESTWSVEQLGNTIGSATDEEYLYLYHHNNVYGHRLSKIDQATGEINTEYTFEPSSYSYTNPAVLTLSKTGTILLFQDSVLRAFDAESLKPRWERDIGRSEHVAVGQGKMFLVAHGILFVLDEFTGQILWVWNPPGGTELNYNLVAFSTHVFVTNGDKTWAISIDSGESVWSYDTGGDMSYSDGKLLINRYNRVAAIDVSQDLDGDGLPRWWERKHGFDDDNANDSDADADDDGLNNTEEYLAGTNPQVTDTDADSISDFDEIQTYNTRPEYADSDEDGLSDGDELTLHLTMPTEKDSDGDTFSDFDEINTYNSNPNDSDSIPAGAIASMQESFESESLPDGWTSSDPAWQTVDFDASEGERSLLSGTADRSIESSIFFEGLFAAGSLTFDSKGIEVDRRGNLSVFVDGQFIEGISLDRQWKSTTIEITEAGNHEIEWRYTNTIYSPSEFGIHHAQIDNVSFSSQ